MDRRDLIKSIYVGICAGVTVPFWPKLLSEPGLQISEYFSPGAYTIHRWELGG